MVMKRLVLFFALVGLGIPVVWKLAYHYSAPFAEWWLQAPDWVETLRLALWPSALLLIADPLDSNVALWIVSVAINAATYGLIGGLLHAVLRRR